MIQPYVKALVDTVAFGTASTLRRIGDEFHVMARRVEFDPIVIIHDKRPEWAYDAWITGKTD